MVNNHMQMNGTKEKERKMLYFNESIK